MAATIAPLDLQLIGSLPDLTSCARNAPVQHRQCLVIMEFASINVGG